MAFCVSIKRVHSMSFLSFLVFTMAPDIQAVINSGEAAVRCYKPKQTSFGDMIDVVLQVNDNPARQIVLVTPKLRLPTGCYAMEFEEKSKKDGKKGTRVAMDNLTNKTKVFVSLAIDEENQDPEVEAWVESMHTLEDKLKAAIRENIDKWSESREDNHMLTLLRKNPDAFFQPIIIPAGQYPPAFKAKAPVVNEHVTTKFYDADGKIIDDPISTVPPGSLARVKYHVSGLFWMKNSNMFYPSIKAIEVKVYPSTDTTYSSDNMNVCSIND
jgi:hypothetical protein